MQSFRSDSSHPFTALKFDFPNRLISKFFIVFSSEGLDCSFDDAKDRRDSYDDREDCCVVASEFFDV